MSRSWERAAKRLKDEHGHDIRTVDDEAVTKLFGDILKEEMGIGSMKTELDRRLSAPQRLQKVMELPGRPDVKRKARAGAGDIPNLRGSAENVREVMKAYAVTTGRDFYWNDDEMGEEQ